MFTYKIWGNSSKVVGLQEYSKRSVGGNGMHSSEICQHGLVGETCEDGGVGTSEWAVQDHPVLAGRLKASREDSLVFVGG